MFLGVSFSYSAPQDIEKSVKTLQPGQLNTTNDWKIDSWLLDKHNKSEMTDSSFKHLSLILSNESAAIMCELYQNCAVM